MPTKINATLTNEANDFLDEFKKVNNLKYKDDAINKLIEDYKKRVNGVAQQL
jgi:hypothetical protein